MEKEFYIVLMEIKQKVLLKTIKYMEYAKLVIMKITNKSQKKFKILMIYKINLDKNNNKRNNQI